MRYESCRVRLPHFSRNHTPPIRFKPEVHAGARRRDVYIDLTGCERGSILVYVDMKEFEQRSQEVQHFRGDISCLVETISHPASYGSAGPIPGP